MIIPEKHVYLSETILGLGGLIISNFSQENTTLDEIWIKIDTLNKKQKYIANLNFDNFILAIDFLFLLGMIEMKSGGILKKCT